MFLLAISPLIPLGLIAGLGGAVYGLYRWMRAAEEPTPPSPIPPGPTPPGPAPEPAPAPSPAPAGKADPRRCSKTGEVYNEVRWTGPDAVQGGLIRLGYFVGPTLTTSADVAIIKKFQRYVRKLKLGPYANAPNSWIHGRMGACTLISLSAAEAELYAGNWVPES